MISIRGTMRENFTCGLIPIHHIFDSSNIVSGWCIEVIQSSGGLRVAARGCCDYQLRWSHSDDIPRLGE